MSENQKPAEDIPVDLDALRLWMDDQRLEKGPLDTVELLAGGSQNILMRFQRGGRDFVLRRPPIHLRKNSNRTMQREARVLQALSGSDVPHPGLIAACDDEDVLGACFYLMEPIEGFNPVNGLPDLHAGDAAIRHRMGLSYIEGMAALGAVDYRAVGLDDFGKPDGFLERQPARWMGQLEGYAAFDNWTGFEALPDVDGIVNWLEKYIPQDFTPGILHGDCHLANTMFEPDTGEMAAFIDWELATVGDPLIDVGWMIATWGDKSGPGIVEIDPWDGFATVDEMLAHYCERTTRNMDSIAWYGVLGCFKLGSILEGTHARAGAGKATKEMGDALHGGTIQLFEKAHKLIAQA